MMHAEQATLAHAEAATATDIIPTVWHQQQNILPESGMTDFHDSVPFAGQPGAASIVSGDAGK